MTADTSYPDIKMEKVSFGSCHSRGAFNKRISNLQDSSSQKIIWDTITSSVDPQTFLWTGDSIYPPRGIKGDTPLSVMQYECEKYVYILFISHPYS